MRKLIFFTGLISICYLIGSMLYRKLYAYERYPNGKIKKSVLFQIWDGSYKFKEFYENGQLKKVYYTINDKFEGLSAEYFPTGQLNSIGRYVKGLEKGDFLTYRKDGKLFVINKYKEGKNYYRKKYIYSSEGKLMDSAYTLQPIIYKQNRTTDSLFYKIGVITDDLNISCDSLDLFYELYGYKREDGLMPYTPTNIAPLKDCVAQDLRLPINPFMGLTTITKSDSLYFFVLIRDRINGKIHENDPVIMPMKW